MLKKSGTWTICTLGAQVLNKVARTATVSKCHNWGLSWRTNLLKYPTCVGKPAFYLPLLHCFFVQYVRHYDRV
jgi:hypothetical protein